MHLYPCGVRRYNVKARLVRNYDVFNYNHRGTTKQIWKMLFVDVEGECVQCTIFSPHVENFLGMFHEGFIYVLRGVQVVHADANNKIVPNWKQMTITSTTVVIREEHDDLAIPTFFYNLVAFNRFHVHANRTDMVFDATGLVLYVSPIESVGQNSVKRDLAIMDKTLTIIKFTIWNEFVHILDDGHLNTEADFCPILFACGLHVKSFRGRTYLTTGFYSRIYVNKVDDLTTSLSTWYESDKLAKKRVACFRSTPFSLQSSIDISNAHRVRLASFHAMRKVQYCRVIANTCHLEHVDNIIYEACHRCLKKVNSFHGVPTCESCNITDVVTIPRLLVRIEICDRSGTLKITMLHDLAQLILGCPATDIKLILQQPNGRKRVMEILVSKLGYKTFCWIIPPPIQDFNPEHSYTVSYVLQVDWAEECMWLTKFYEGKFHN
ncbi:replication protein A 70 kDa DNA-binding subunit B-like [Beta vulgaris subsp. vulgaris]|uniref:replication protein A 70 kDa DNA-binding subunit B-like n=1 Tax=Beta vulgaris subsp. vulgaris TaxID=3555 RepID=UPI0020375AA5|nr:replication protein A 70 kDa DNA-binding subunit B-like [Beta vulgaris subsp. vulgaris]